ncbi:MAG: transcription termination factor NusA [Candidatus Dormiibacterota bacterium]
MSPSRTGATPRRRGRGAAEPEPESLLVALDALSASVGITKEDLLRTVESALGAAYQRAFEVPTEVAVHLDAETGALTATTTARNADGGDERRSLPVDEFRRLAAQTARTAVLRHLRDLERDRALEELSRQHGQIATGFIDRVDDRGAALVDLGKVEGWLPREEQIPGEALHPGGSVTVVVLEPNASRGQVRVSRANRAFVLRLLEAEVPEIAAGTVQVKGIAREPGLRTKIAVASMDSGVDAVGACVGPRGVRHRSLVAQLGQEHVDVVAFETDPERFVAAALGPARVSEVSVDAETRTANVRVPKDQLSLAIGRDGQNARLAAKLTGWRIDIKSADEEVHANRQ